MPDSKISALTEDTDPALGDFFVTDDVSAGANKKVQLTNVLKNTGVIASLEYTGGVPGSYGLTSATLTAVDTTNLRLTFNAPVSGNVEVLLAGATGISTVAGWLDFGILEGAATVGQPRTVHYEAVLLNDLIAMHEAKIKVTGLVAGSSHTYDFAWRCGGGSTISLSKGAPNGITMIVMAVP